VSLTHGAHRNLAGIWSAGVWNNDEAFAGQTGGSCAASTGTDAWSYVMDVRPPPPWSASIATLTRPPQHGDAFGYDAQWEVNYMKVYDR
jgi:hypothetical protein